MNSWRQDTEAVRDFVAARVPRRSLLSLAVAGFAVAGLSGCGPFTSQADEEAVTLELTFSQGLDDAIGELGKGGGEQLLSEVIDVKFDELLVFPEGARVERVNAAAGGELLNGEYYQSSTQLFLFRAGGLAALAVMVAADFFEHDIQNANFGPAVKIVAPGDRQLTLAD